MLKELQIGLSAEVLEEMLRNLENMDIMIGNTKLSQLQIDQKDVMHRIGTCTGMVIELAEKVLGRVPFANEVTFGITIKMIVTC